MLPMILARVIDSNACELGRRCVAKVLLKKWQYHIAAILFHSIPFPEEGSQRIPGGSDLAVKPGGEDQQIVGFVTRRLQGEPRMIRAPHVFLIPQALLPQRWD